MISRILIGLGVSMASVMYAASYEASPEQKCPVRVLFIGNSYTAINDLPALTARLAASAQPPRTLETEFAGEGGATLKRHWEAGRALASIRKGGFDYVVLQDQGTLGPSDDFRSINDPALFHTYARLFDAEIRKSGAKTLFFLTWARQDSPENQALLTGAYRSIANELNALIAPVGVAWQRALKKRPDVVLHHADRSHPGPAGSYLAAAVFYAVLFSRSPEGLSRADLVAEDAAFLQRIAWQTVTDPQALADVKSSVLPQRMPAETDTARVVPEALERGRAILATAQQGMGGLERLRALKDVSIAFSARVHSPQGEMSIEGRDVLVFPDLLRSEMQSPMGRIISFTDGTTGWRQTPQGVQDLPDRIRKILRAHVLRNTFTLLRADGNLTVQFEKRERDGEVEADVILVRNEEESVRLFVHAASGALLKKTFHGIGMGGPAGMEEVYSDNRDISGIRVPFHIEVLQNGAPFLSVSVSEVTFNSGVDPAELGKRPQAH